MPRVNQTLLKPILTLALCGLAFSGFEATAWAVPSFARQTGFSCAQCHTQFPELTPFGRAFKASGYTMMMKQAITDTRDERTILSFLQGAPLSAMMWASVTNTQQALPGANGGQAQKTDVSFPQQLSLFYAGRIAPELGTFTQITYEASADALSMDNVDIRYAHPMTFLNKSLILGLSLNNNPTVTDLYQGVPAWSWPYAGSDSAPGPSASPLISDALGQASLGLDGYLRWNGMVYLEAGVYRSDPLGVTRPLGSANDATDVITGVAPYWRLAVEKDFGPHSIEVGTYGLAASIFPGGNAPLSGPTDKFVDYGVDAQYQYITNNHIVTANAGWLHENQTWDASEGGTKDGLDEINASAGYIFHRLVGVKAGYFGLSGTTDTALYAPDPVDGSANGSPDSNGLIGEIDVTPWLNTKFSLQYTAYFKFNGASTNYDGSGRDASGNNTLYAMAWLAF